MAPGTINILDVRKVNYPTLTYEQLLTLAILYILLDDPHLLAHL